MTPLLLTALEKGGQEKGFVWGGASLQAVGIFQDVSSGSCPREKLAVDRDVRVIWLTALPDTCPVLT